jgi:L-ribulokinase
MIFSKEKHRVSGICGVVRNSVLPDLYAYEAGQACVGDLLDWFVQNSVPAREFDAANGQGVDIHTHLCEQAKQIPPGANGLMALDWWNGQRSPYVDDRLSGLMLGMTVRTTPAEQYRALMESTAFGTRLILDTFEQGGVAVERVMACGGISQKNPLMMQIYADVLNRPVYVTGQMQTAALGAAILAASAAGLYGTPEEAVRAMTGPAETVYLPHEEHTLQYESLYREYRALSEYFAKESPVMHRLSALWH